MKDGGEDLESRRNKNENKPHVPSRHASAGGAPGLAIASALSLHARPAIVPLAPMTLDVSTENGTYASPAPQTDEKRAATPNVLEVVFGSLLIKPWYPSFYPEELVGRKVERLYVCQWCFKYSKELTGFIKHMVSALCSCCDCGADVPAESMRTAKHGAAWYTCVHF